MDPTARGPCGQPAATDSNLTNNTVTLPSSGQGKRRFATLFAVWPTLKSTNCANAAGAFY